MRNRSQILIYLEVSHKDRDIIPPSWTVSSTTEPCKCQRQQTENSSNYSRDIFLVII